MLGKCALVVCLTHGNLAEYQAMLPKHHVVVMDTYATVYSDLTDIDSIVFDLRGTDDKPDAWVSKTTKQNLYEWFQATFKDVYQDNMLSTVIVCQQDQYDAVGDFFDNRVMRDAKTIC